MFLSLPEELLLLLLDDESGRIEVRQQIALDVALSSAVLMDLALHTRIDTDVQNLWLISDDKVGHPILDGFLSEIAEQRERQPIQFWLHRFYDNSHAIRDRSLARLVEQQILVEEEKRYLWFFHERRYPTINGRAEREVKYRIMQILFSDDIPDPRDISLISLCNATGFFQNLLSGAEFRSVGPRIEQISKMDFVAHAIPDVIGDFITLRMQSMPPH